MFTNIWRMWKKNDSRKFAFKLQPHCKNDFIENRITFHALSLIPHISDHVYHVAKMWTSKNSSPFSTKSDALARFSEICFNNLWKYTTRNFVIFHFYIIQVCAFCCCCWTTSFLMYTILFFEWLLCFICKQTIAYNRIVLWALANLQDIWALFDVFHTNNIMSNE